LRTTLACVLALIAPLHLHAQPAGTISLDAYVADLDRLVSTLSNASPADAHALAITVPLRWRVRTGGDAIAVDGTWIIHELRDGASSTDWPGRRNTLSKRLGEMRTHAAGVPERGLDEPGKRVRAAVTDVLSRREFQNTESGWMAALQRTIVQWIEGLFERLGGRRFANRNTAVVLAWIAAFAAFAGLGIWLARLLDKPRAPAELGFARSLAPRVSAREWTLRALAAIRAGDVREAVRCAYNSALRRIEEQGTWRIDQSRTPREYLRLLDRDDSRGPAVRDLTEQFEQVWYGNRTITEDDARRIGKNLETLGCLSPAERAI
jgi:hypothetical protein